MSAADGAARGQSEDCVSYRDMVEYVNGAVSEFHAIRAESLVRIGVELEKIEEQFASHQDWHRGLLERMLESGKNGRVAMASLTVAALGVLVAIVAVWVGAR